ncbi:MAG: DNA methyltransferase [Flavobacterium sp.]|uniref:DNA adenine methylase n=1 Tax=Flavobacterium sp. TaxID=239 RepID=UPI000C55E8E3|nr:DNA adenine methylase [Flavobacterium sp.]MBF02411.1 DNA methyltransferase [Flavobacterium sp.]|tara:strand:- start:1960 stop:3021 length:1062 start_codon:yes stop_codon:yes gene_type:complete
MPDIVLPQTRYYGSKRKIVDKIWNIIVNEANLEFDSVLDVFGGSASFSYFAKLNQKQVLYNDIFQFNAIIGRKLIEQNTNELTYENAVGLFDRVPEVNYLNHIAEYYNDIYFTDEENNQIDVYIQNVLALENENVKCSALYILFQSCLMKRPYNLFHRRNLNMRLNYTTGNFGNKQTWERSFEELFIRFIKELDQVCFNNGRINTAHNFSALNCHLGADLVYIDPPYFKKESSTSYHSKYHFLEGLVNYYDIPENINFNKNNREIVINASREFEDKNNFLNDLRILINNHIDSHIVISYRNNGIPSIEEISELLREFNVFEVLEYNLGKYNYALNKNNNLNQEVLFICKKIDV